MLLSIVPLQHILKLENKVTPTVANITWADPLTLWTCPWSPAALDVGLSLLAPSVPVPDSTAGIYAHLLRKPGALDRRCYWNLESAAWRNGWDASNRFLEMMKCVFVVINTGIVCIALLTLSMLVRALYFSPNNLFEFAPIRCNLECVNTDLLKKQI